MGDIVLGNLFDEGYEWDTFLGCPRTDTGAKNVFCREFNSCALPRIVAVASSQREAKEIMKKGVGITEVPG